MLQAKIVEIKKNKGENTPNPVVLKKLSLDYGRLEVLRSLANIETLSYRKSSSMDEENSHCFLNGISESKEEESDSPLFPIESDEEDFDGFSSSEDADSPSPIFPQKKGESIIGSQILHPEEESLNTISLKKKGNSLLERRKGFALNFSLPITQIKDENIEIERMRYRYSFYCGTRPITWQKQAAQVVINTLRNTPKPNFTISLLNVTSSSTVSLLRDYNMKKSSRRINIVVTAPHLYFCSEKILDSMTQFKFGQPIRNRRNRKLLLYHLKVRSLSCVSSGHMYVPRHFKSIDNGCFIKSFSGK